MTFRSAAFNERRVNENVKRQDWVTEFVLAQAADRGASFQRRRGEHDDHDGRSWTTEVCSGKCSIEPVFELESSFIEALRQAFVLNPGDAEAHAAVRPNVGAEPRTAAQRLGRGVDD